MSFLSRAGDVKTRSLYREVKSFIQANNESSLLFTRNLTDNAEVYKNLLTAQVEDELSSKYLKDIKELELIYFIHLC